MCIKSAGITENVHKICRYYKKCAQNLQVLLKMYRKSAGRCRKSAGIIENMQKICRSRFKVVIIALSAQSMDVNHVLCGIPPYPPSSHWFLITDHCLPFVNTSLLIKRCKRNHITCKYVQHTSVLVSMVFFPVLAIMDLSDQ